MGLEILPPPSPPSPPQNGCFFGETVSSRLGLRREISARYRLEMNRTDGPHLFCFHENVRCCNNKTTCFYEIITYFDEVITRTSFIYPSSYIVFVFLKCTCSGLIDILIQAQVLILWGFLNTLIKFLSMVWVWMGGIIVRLIFKINISKIWCFT